VLVALCRPVRDGEPYALPDSNQAIAEEVHPSVGAVTGGYQGSCVSVRY
jgi:hypothetical protein